MHVGMYVQARLPIAHGQTLGDINEPFMCFRLALMHSTTYILPLSFAILTILAVIHHPSANLGMQVIFITSGATSPSLHAVFLLPH